MEVYNIRSQFAGMCQMSLEAEIKESGGENTDDGNKELTKKLNNIRNERQG